MIRTTFIVLTLSALTGCVQPLAPVTVDESTEAFVKRVIESGNGTAAEF